MSWQEARETLQSTKSWTKFAMVPVGRDSYARNQMDFHGSYKPKISPASPSSPSSPSSSRDHHSVATSMSEGDPLRGQNYGFVRSFRLFLAGMDDEVVPEDGAEHEVRAHLMQMEPVSAFDKLASLGDDVRREIRQTTFVMLLWHLQRIKSLGKMQVVVKWMGDAGYMRCKRSACLLMQSLVEAGEIAQATELLERAKADNLADAFLYNVAIMGRCSRGEMDVAMALCDDMIKSGIWPDNMTLNQLIGGFVAIGDIESCLQVLNDMKDQFGLVPVPATCSALLSSRSFLYGSVESAFTFIEHLRNCDSRAVAKYARSSTPYNVLMMSRAYNNNLHGAFQVYHGMRATKIEPDSRTFGTLLRALVRYDGFDEYLDFLLTEMVNAGIKHSSATLNHAMRALINRGRIDEAVALLASAGHTMSGIGHCYRAIVIGLCSGSSPHITMAMAMLDEYARVAPDHEVKIHFGSLASPLRKALHQVHAFDELTYIDRMSRFDQSD
jgi:pentatricopeptide repeat protein